MSFANQIRGQLTEARNTLIERRRQTNDAHERTAIDAAIAACNEVRDLVDQAVLLDAAEGVMEATAALERVVSGAKLEPFDDYVAALKSALDQIAHVIQDSERRAFDSGGARV